MKSNKIILVVISLTIFATLIFASCQKELSCEGCGDSNKPPTANAGPDQTIILPKDSVILDGTASYDSDGTIKSYKWIIISGPPSSFISKSDVSKTSITSLVMGVYQVELTVTDNGGLSAKDTLLVKVDNPAINQPPIANAGSDQTFNLPTVSVTLNGSSSADPDNNIIAYAWTKISGPSSSNILNANIVQTQVTSLVQGVYLFELKVTDAGGLFSKDTVQIMINGTVTSVQCASNRPEINARLVPLGTLSKPRSGLAVASAGNKIVFAGGEISPNVPSSTVDIFDFTTNAWTTAELSQARAGIATAVLDKKIYFAGGTSGGGRYSGRVDIFDTERNTWTTIDLAAVEALMAGAAAGNKVVFASGVTAHIYDVKTNTWTTAPLSIRPGSWGPSVEGIAATAIGDNIYFAGGWDLMEVHKAIDIYNTEANIWSKSSLNEHKGALAGIAVNNTNYWAGGYTHPSGLSCQVEIRNMNSGAVSFGNLFQSNYHFSAVQNKDTIVFFTGLGAIKNKFDIYALNSNNWLIGILPENIEGAAIISVNNTIYVAGGKVNGSLSNQVRKLEF